MICTTYFLTFFSELIPPTGLSNSQAMQDSVLVARGIVQVGDTIGFQKFESNPSLQVIEYPSENFTPFDLGDNGGIFRLVRTEVGLELEAE